ncbi:TPA: acyltransferase [Klebsiella quasipneumoniae subsp. quasipneumoniae]|nr:acyltransferase [Klebsiella quasipneumoniae subsp. quasipneumoniae]
MNTKLNHWLDFCRALAISLVLLSHGRTFLVPLMPETNILKFGGFLGVELFFVLSGFLIGRILIEKINNQESHREWIPSFWLRRWLRTYPSYILFLFINIILIFSIRPDIFPSVLRYLTFSQSLLSPHPSFFGEAWSLAVEEIFYLITPLLFWVFFALTNNKKTSINLAIVVLITLPLALRINAAFNSSLTFNEIRTISLFRIDSIVYGVLGLIICNTPTFNKMKMIGVALIPLCIFISAQDDELINNNAFYKVFLFPMANIGFAFMICGWIHIQISKQIMYIVSRIARWSYAAYLINLPVIFLLKQTLPTPTTYASCITQWLLFFLLTLSLSCFIYNTFEKTILKARDKLISS